MIDGIVTAGLEATLRMRVTYRAWVDWYGVQHPVVVSAIGTDILIGMKLLANHEMRMEIAPDGIVELRLLQR